MAIEHTRSVQRIECYPNGNVMVVYLDKFDDPNDDMLPTETNKVIHLAPHSDVSKHLQYVQDVCAGAWINISLPELVEPVITQKEEPSV